jgi:hypothetical protein
MGVCSMEKSPCALLLSWFVQADQRAAQRAASIAALHAAVW